MSTSSNSAGRIGTGRQAGDDPYELVADYLRASSRWPWKSASYLGRVLRERHGFEISPEALEQVLIQRIEDGPVRYSQYPGRQSLDLIWGHIDNVGELAALWDLDLDEDTLREEIGVMKLQKLHGDAEWIFVSHSFRNFDAVRNLRGALVRLGHAVWLAETHILDGEPIIAKVQEGLEKADHFALYATRQSLGSRWVLKEGGVAARLWKLPATVIVDRSDRELVELFQDSVASGWAPGLLHRVAELFPDAPIDPVAATDISQLLLAALAETKSDRRVVVLHPERGEDSETSGADRWHRTLSEAFPARSATAGAG